MLRWGHLAAEKPRAECVFVGGFGDFIEKQFETIRDLAARGFSVWCLDILFGQIGPGLAELFKFIGLMFPPSTGGHLQLFLQAMGETLSIALLGTLAAAGRAMPLALLAAANTSPNGILRFLVRRLLDVIRGVDTLIWALVFVGVVGLGPFAGILAIAVSDTGAFGKLFSEAIEATRARDARPFLPAAARA